MPFKKRPKRDEPAVECSRRKQNESVLGRESQQQRGLGTGRAAGLVAFLTIDKMPDRSNLGEENFILANGIRE